jgi:cysteinyl-tRNA synthetase
MLQIHNSLTRHKADFVPLEPGKVSLYVCGMTVYDHCHLLATPVSWWCSTSYMRWSAGHLGYEVIYVRNITDIDDKIIRRAQGEWRSLSGRSLTARFIQRHARRFGRGPGHFAADGRNRAPPKHIDRHHRA